MEKNLDLAPIWWGEWQWAGGEVWRRELCDETSNDKKNFFLVFNLINIKISDGHVVVKESCGQAGEYDLIPLGFKAMIGCVTKELEMIFVFQS